jgi:hypothetical protein
MFRLRVLAWSAFVIYLASLSTIYSLHGLKAMLIGLLAAMTYYLWANAQDEIKERKRYARMRDAIMAEREALVAPGQEHLMTAELHRRQRPLDLFDPREHFDR